jgi:hypothetical protein
MWRGGIVDMGVGVVVPMRMPVVVGMPVVMGMAGMTMSVIVAVAVRRGGNHVPDVIL